MAATKTDIWVYADWKGMGAPKCIGVISAQQSKGNRIFGFEYTKDWLKSDQVFLLDPQIGLYSGTQYPDKKDNFGVFMDSMPDTWGRKLMLRRVAQMALAKGESPQKLYEIDFLLGVHDVSRMGALRFKLDPNGPFLDDNKDNPTPPITHLRELQASVKMYEEDEEVRELAVRILAAFQTRNSVEALTQVALYDLSSSLRSKAVTVLTDFDHETVFETILLACADPTREVRAAAARGLTRFSFDRADAWTRILQINETGRMRHAARAAIEGGFVERSFDRLVHRDAKYSYEAFVLLALIITAGEYDQIVEALKNHRDMKVKRAILHILKVVKNQASVSVLYSMLEEKNLSAELKEEIDKTIEQIVLVAA